MQALSRGVMLLARSALMVVTLGGWGSLVAAVLVLASLFNAAVSNAATAVPAASDQPALNCATDALYVGQENWAPRYSRCTDALP